MKSIVLLVLGVFFTGLVSGTGEYNIKNFGAVSDSTRLSTEAIQTAIDRCNADGGGTVLVPAGWYVTGSLVLKDNVNLNLSKGATLLGSKNYYDYPPRKTGYVALRTRGKTKQLIYAENAGNISITGEGEIDGQGRIFPNVRTGDIEYDRPCLIQFINCRKILIENVSLRNSGFWMQHYLGCDELRISGIRVFNHNNYNNDGIDIDGCRNVIISDSMIDSDDDALCLKSTSGRASENISISNCILSSHCNALKMGTESNTGFRNISISNITIKPSKTNDSKVSGQMTGISGIALEMVDGGILDGVVISNVMIDGTSSPIFIRLGNRARPYSDDMVINNVGTLRNISISNVVAVKAGKYGCSITGIPGYAVENISLNNISIEFEGGGAKNDITREIPEEEKKYPEATMFGILPSYGFFIRHASNIHFSNVTLRTTKDDARPAICLTDVRNSGFRDLVIGSNAGVTGNLLIDSSSDIDISGCRVTGKTGYFVEPKGGKNRNIFLVNNILTNARKIYNPAGNAKKAVRLTGNIR